MDLPFCSIASFPKTLGLAFFVEFFYFKKFNMYNDLNEKFIINIGYLNKNLVQFKKIYIFLSKIYFYFFLIKECITSVLKLF